MASILEQKMTFTQLRAYEWLINKRGLERIDLSHGEDYDDPTFVYYGTHGYEVSLLHGKTLKFNRRRYKSLCNWGDKCELLVFEPNEDMPEVVIPFNKLPYNGGVYRNIKIVLSTSSKQSMIAFSTQEKDKLEQIRAIIENNLFPQDDWGDIITQAMYCLLNDQKLMQAAHMNRINVTTFTAICPYCNTDNPMKSVPKLYWLVKCKYCSREFVAKK